jgi:hypothetical protein
MQGILFLHGSFDKIRKSVIINIIYGQEKSRAREKHGGKRRCPGVKHGSRFTSGVSTLYFNWVTATFQSLFKKKTCCEMYFLIRYSHAHGNGRHKSRLFATAHDPGRFTRMYTKIYNDKYVL